MRHACGQAMSAAQIVQHNLEAAVPHAAVSAVQGAQEALGRRLQGLRCPRLFRHLCECTHLAVRSKELGISRRAHAALFLFVAHTKGAEAE